MEKVVKINKSEDELNGCNTCRSYNDIYDIRFKTGSSTTVFGMCDSCLKQLDDEIDMAVRY